VPAPPLIGSFATSASRRADVLKAPSRSDQSL